MICLVFVWMCKVDPFAKKDLYDIKAPSLFQVKNVGKTFISHTQGTKVLFFKYSTKNWNFSFFIVNLLVLCCGSIVWVFKIRNLFSYSFDLCFDFWVESIINACFHFATGLCFYYVLVSFMEWLIFLVFDVLSELREAKQNDSSLFEVCCSHQISM